MPAFAEVRAQQRGSIDLGLMLPPVEGAVILSDPVWSEEWLAALVEGYLLAGPLDWLSSGRGPVTKSECTFDKIDHVGRRMRRQRVVRGTRSRRDVACHFTG